MVKHQAFQVYEKQVFLSVVTGIYGCRWKRYQRSQDSSSMWECAWFIILCSSFVLLLFWVYFWLVAQNDFNDFNWLVFNRSGEWSDETIPILTSTTVGFVYITFLLILALSHISLGQQLNLYWVHKIGVLATLFTTISGVVSVDDIWRDEWSILLVSLQSTAPFLHLAALVTVTAISWLVAGYVVRKQRSNFQGMVLVVYIVIHLALCLVPLTFTCPCIMDRKMLKPAPSIIGQRGAPMLAPENTMMSFNRALQHGASSLEADITISVDGVPFLMRDRTLRRTTDVRRVFPSRQFEDASFFNWTELRSLNSGRWFLESDPYWTVKTLSVKDRSRIGNLTVCSLVEMLRLAARANSSALLNVRKPSPDHPRFRSWFMDTLWSLQKAGISQKRVTWTPDTDRGRVRGLHQATKEKLSLQEIKQRGITSLTLDYRKTSLRDIQKYLASNVSVTVYPINEPWLYSLLWCSGVPSVSSDAPQILRKVPYPVWLMSRSAYNFIWITSDLVSLAVVMGIFFFQKSNMNILDFTRPPHSWRPLGTTLQGLSVFVSSDTASVLSLSVLCLCCFLTSGSYHMIRWRISGMQNYNPEQIMLSAVARRPSRNVNIMKEKLIFSDGDNGLGSTEELCENGNMRYSYGDLSC